MMPNSTTVGDCVAILLNAVAASNAIDNGMTCALPTGCNYLFPQAQTHVLRVAARLIEDFPLKAQQGRLCPEVAFTALRVQAGSAELFPRLMQQLEALTGGSVDFDDEPCIIL